MGPSPSTEKTVRKTLPWIPDLPKEIWILVAGQLLLFIGQGFTLVYAAIFFVNQLGFSATQVGIALSSSGLSGILGRFLAGTAIDSPRLGRKGTLMLAAFFSAIACFCLAYAHTFPLLVTGNLLLGLGVSLYWPATLAVTTDLTTTANRSEAFALSQLSNNLGLGLGALLAGQFIARSGSYQALFLAKGAFFLVFALVIYGAIAETCQTYTTLSAVTQNWLKALGDRRLVTFLAANTFFAFYGSQLSSSLPLYLANFIPAGNSATGFSEQVISYLFFFHALLKIVGQMPITRWVKRIDHVSILLFVLVLWLGGSLFFWLAGVVSANAIAPTLAGFTILALAEILYGPSASSLVGNMAPAEQRGIYFSLESECWAIGFLVGPALGGWVLDQPVHGGATLWLGVVASTGIAGIILAYLKQQTEADAGTRPLTVAEADAPQP